MIFGLHTLLDSFKNKVEGIIISHLYTLIFKQSPVVEPGFSSRGGQMMSNVLKV